MAVTAQQVFKELSQDDFKGVCLVVGDEPFQAAEIEGRFRTTLVRSRAESEFNCEVWDGESLGSGEKLLNSLETLPGLFSEPNSRRLVIVKQF